MRVVVFVTPAEQARGLQYRRYIEPDTLFVFPGIPSKTTFHSRNVPEPFDLAFLDSNHNVLAKRMLTPTHDTMDAPEGASIALEAKAGWLDFWGCLPGRQVDF